MPHDYFSFISQNGVKTPAEWKSYGPGIRRALKEIEGLNEKHAESASEVAKERDKLSWLIGDWILAANKVEGLKPGAVKRYVRVQLENAKSIGTLNNIQTVCEAFEDTSRRRENLSFSHHLVVAKREFSLEQQERLLDHAEGYRTDRDALGKKIPVAGRYPVQLSIRELRAHIVEQQKGGYLPRTGKGKGTPMTTVNIKIPTSSHDRLKTMAKSLCEREFGANRPLAAPTAASVIWWMAGKYYEEHRDELEASCGISPTTSMQSLDSTQPGKGWGE